MTSIKRIVKHSLDPDFRLQCRQLLKVLLSLVIAFPAFEISLAIEVLDHRYPFTTLDHTSKSHHRTNPRQQTTAEAAFYLAMQRVFKSGMKWTEYKAIFGHLSLSIGILGLNVF